MLAAHVLFALGVIDLVRGVLHTFLIHWSVRTFAKLDLSTNRQDQLTLLGAFGISNLLTGALFLLISTQAPSLAPPVLLAIPCAYALGVIGMRISGVKPQSPLYGRYFMMGYLAVCVATVILSRVG